MHRSAPELPDWLAPLVPFERYLVDLDGIAFHVMERGVGTPVLCIHGNPTWGFLYRKVARALDPGRFRVLMPDLPGLGFSSRIPAEEHQLGLHAERLAGLFKALELDRPPVLVIQDWGGPIGALAAKLAGLELAGLVVMNTVLGAPKAGARSTAFHSFSRTPLLSDLVFRLAEFPQAFLGSTQGDPSSISGLTRAAYRYPLKGFGRNVAPLALARMVPAGEGIGHPSIPGLEQVADWIAAYKGAASVIWGKRDPILGRLGGRAARALPRAKVIETDAGHFLQEEVSELIASEIRRLAP